MKELFESIIYTIGYTLVKLAYLAAACWMMYNGWYGCGITTLCLSVVCWTITLTRKTKNNNKQHEENEK